MKNSVKTDKDTVKTISKEEIAASGSFLCSHCGHSSKLSRLPEKPGLYKITCFTCKQMTYLKVSPTVIKPKPEIITYSTSENKPSTLPTPTKESEKLDLLIKSLKEKQTENPADKTSGVPIEEPQNPKVQSQPVQERKFPPLFEKKKILTKEKEEVQEPKKNFKDFLWEKHTPLIFRSNRFFIFMFVFILLLLCVSIPMYIGYSNAYNELDALLVELKKNKASHIYDRNGNLLSEIYQKKTGTSKIEDFPPKLLKMVLSVEDKNFFDHGGIDYIAIVRATFKNIANMRYSQGASTITMQLSRILLNDRRKSITRKVKEAFIALAMESKLSKAKILEAYMNQVYLGHGAFGFENGAMYYFNKTLKELSTKEMILLSSLASAPNRYSPFKNPKLSKQRVASITKTLVRGGLVPSSTIEEFDDFYAKLKEPPFRTVFGSRFDEAPFVTEHVRGILQALNPDKSIYDEGGYKVETTVVIELQKETIDIVEDHVTKLVKSKTVKKVNLRNTKSNEDPELQAAVIGLDPASGEIYFMHGGGGNFSSTNQFNRAIQMKRQTGSSIKGVLYSAAIDSGRYHTGMKVLDAPLIFKGSKGQEDWKPSNFGKDYEGEMFLREALMKSKNTVAVQIAESIGLSLVSKYFERFFFPDKSEYVKRYREDLSVSLGSIELSPLEMASAYSAFANDGMIKRPFLIKRILSSKGKVLYSHENSDEFQLKVPDERKAIEPDTAEVMLSLITSSAGASSVRKTGYKGSVAGKTGTTNDYKDAWFVGVRPGLSMSVWVGYDDSGYGMGPGGLGSSAAAPLWGSIAKKIDSYQLLTARSYSFSKNAIKIRICKESGDRATMYCPFIKDEVFTSRSRPSTDCKLPHIPNGDSTKTESIKSIF
jgi:penicillin-binding protein 1A